jgi:hypothetical protein
LIAVTACGGSSAEQANQQEDQMDIIRPQSINNVTMLYSSIAETDHAAWAVGTTYTVGDRRILVSPTATITMTIASPCVVTWANHGLENDTPVMFTTTGALPTGVVAGTVYYVRNKTTNTFNLSLKKSGAAVNTSGSQSGTHTGTAQVHKVFESLQANNVGHYPLISPTWWLLVGSTNRWAMFDDGVATQSSNAGSIKTVIAGINNSDSIGLFNVSAEYVRITHTNLTTDGLLVVPEKSFTVTIASPGVFTLAGRANGETITLRTTGALPTGLSALNTVYYVINVSGSTFNLALTPGGAAINTSGTQSGTHYLALVSSDTWLSLVGAARQGAWDVLTAKYANRSLSVAAREGTMNDFAFSVDGTKLYVIGSANNTIYQYALPLAYDISTAYYASKSMSAAAQETISSGITFSADGTKAYIVGTANDTIFQYTLTTAWDISTGSYSGKSMVVSAQETVPHAISFSADGTKAYVTGNAPSSIFQYTLTTAWDISTGSYSGNSMSLSGGGEGHGLAFSTDGLRVFVATYQSGYSVEQYTLTTAWDISTGSYSGKKFLTYPTDSTPSGVAFSSDGSKMYTGGLSDNIYQYSVGDIWLVSDAVNIDLANYATSRVIVELVYVNGDVLCGELTFGSDTDLGGTQYGAQVGIKDYSIKKQDDFGNLTVVERGYSKRATFLILMDNDYIDYFQTLLASYRATPIVWIGSTQYGSTQLLGYYTDFSIEIAYPNHSLCSIEIEGLV